MTQAVTRQGLGIAASNLLLAAMYLIFAYLHLNGCATTTRPSLLLVVAAETLLVVFILIRRDPDATWHSWWTWLTMLGGTFLPLLFRPTAAAEEEQSIPFMKEQAGAFFGVHMNADYVSARAFRKAPSVGLGHGVTVFQERLELLQ